MSIHIPPRIKAKLAAKAPPVTEAEVFEAFENRCGQFLMDSREEHATDPPTLWFVAETNAGRILKVMFVPDGTNTVKSAYDATEEIQGIYDRHAK